MTFNGARLRLELPDPAREWTGCAALVSHQGRLRLVQLAEPDTGNRVRALALPEDPFRDPERPYERALFWCSRRDVRALVTFPLAEGTTP